MSQFSDQILRQLKAGAQQVRAAGEELSSRVKAFESWLSRLPGKCPTECILSATEDGVVTTYLSFERDGKSWGLFTYDFIAPAESISDRKPLRDASIEEKAACVKLFPQLLDSMLQSQRSLVDKATRAVNEFDTFAGSIGMKEEA